MKLTLTTFLACALLAIGAPLAGAQPDNFFEADGCDVMAFVEALDPGTHTGSWLVESILTGDRYTYTYDQTDALAVFAPDGLSIQQVIYVNWRLEELGAKGTNRTGVRTQVTQELWPFDFDGEIIRGTKYPRGGIGGTGTYDPATGEVAWDQVNLIFCQSHR